MNGTLLMIKTGGKKRPEIAFFCTFKNITQKRTPKQEEKLVNVTLLAIKHGTRNALKLHFFSCVKYNVKNDYYS